MSKLRLSSIFTSAVFVSFILLVVLSPTIHFIPYNYFHDSQRVIQLALLALILFEAVAAGQDQSCSIRVDQKIGIGLYSILALGIISSLKAVEPRYGIIEVSVFVALCFLTLFVVKNYLEKPELIVKNVVYSLIISAGLYLLSFFTGYITALLNNKPLAWPYPFYGFTNIRLFQQYQLWGFGLIFLPLLNSNLKKNIKILISFGLVLWWTLMLYAASRGALIAWALGLIATSIVFKKHAIKFIRSQLIAGLAGLACYWMLFRFIPNLISPIQTSTILRDNVNDRLELWEASLSMMTSHPLLGVGPMHFYFYNNYGTHPHNTVMQIVAEWGLPVTAILGSIVIYATTSWLKQFNQKNIKFLNSSDKELSIALFFTLVSNAAYSLVDGVIVMPISQVLMFTMIGLTIGQYVRIKNYPEYPLTHKCKMRPLLAGACIVSLITSVSPELIRGLTSYNRPMALGEMNYSIAPNTINPRLWMQQRKPSQVGD